MTGELSVRDGKLDGAFINQFSQTVFDTDLKEGAGRAAQLIARVLESTNQYMMRIGFGGTLEDPRLSLASDMDQIFQTTIQGAIQLAVGELTANLKQRISTEVGPEIAAARQQFTALESLQAELQESLEELNSLAAQR
jgi:hypothetical protein